MKKLFVCLASLMLALSLCLALCSCKTTPVQINSDTKQDEEPEPVKPDDENPTDEPTDEPSEDGGRGEQPEPIPADDEPTPVPVDDEPEPIAPADDEPEPKKHEVPEDDPPVLPDTDIKGRLTSEQSKGLKLVVDWAYVADTGKVAAIVSLRSYSIHVKAKPVSGSVTVGESTQKFSTPELINEENEAKTFYVAELEFDAPDSTSIPISALWNFGGTYSGIEIEALTVEGTIELA